jgi:hypothetical protein
MLYGVVAALAKAPHMGLRLKQCTIHKAQGTNGCALDDTM